MIKLLSLFILPLVLTADTKFPYTIEGEDLLDENGKKCELWKDIYGKQFPGYTGEGFAYLNGGALSFKVTVPESAMYAVSIVAAQILDKGGRHQTIAVNGVEYSKDIPYTEEWKKFDFGIVRLKAGENTISFLNKYGYMEIDSVTVDIPVYPDLKEADSVPCDKLATDETKAVMKYLHSIYGEKVLSGQQEIYGSGHNNNYEYEMDYLEELTGTLPAIRGFDLLNFNNLYGWDDGCVDRAAEWWKKGGLVTACYHLNIPTNFGSYKVGDRVEWSAASYKPNSAFSVANASKKGTKENDFINANLEIIAEQFLKLQDIGVAVIWRPLHEAEGNPGIGNAWFWWGQEGPEPFKALWKYYFTTLTETYGVHNLIWELNLYTWNDASADWYPGDEYVDIVGYDKYNVVYNRHDGKTSGPNLDAESGLFYNLVKMVKGKKMVSMPENDTVPSLSNMQTEHAPWLYFCTWYDNEGDSNFISGENFQDKNELKTLYQSEFCVTRDELPKFTK